MTTAKTLALSAHNLTRALQLGEQRIEIFSAIDFAVATGQSCAILGASGSGKTTLLGVLAGMDPPDTGVVDVTWGGETFNIYDHNEDWRAALRGKMMGFVFQNFQLIPDMTALDNVLLPLQLLNNGDETLAKQWLHKVGLGERLNHYPRQLSGGEQQRVALARAFAHEPALLLADEPTGSLDAKTAGMIMDLLFDLHRSTQSTMVLVTHDRQLAARCDTVFELSTNE
ncbi:MAG: ABC transporter ATP-binding protein [Pseudomonadales bacterium]|nr:ABC transporter ATP-binding protein [Pseudomonadales bacterium]MDG1663337.1 ABC transporter ATP-binding protein [Pseudomonadales bacterium]MDG2079423.1 ABC transporter ATP-binding protein [Pseudomonadales bacterium]